MSLILNIQTFDREHNCIIISKENNIIDKFDCYEANSENIHNIIANLLKRNNINIKSFSAIGICIGPGSFTGLRIGVSSAKGLCYGLKIPIIAVSVFEIMMFDENFEFSNIFIITKSSKDIYIATYNKNKLIEYKNLREFDSRFIDELIKNKCNILIDPKLDEISKLKENNIKFKSIKPNEDKMTKCVYEKFERGEFSSIYTLSPLYIRDFKPTT